MKDKILELIDRKINKSYGTLKFNESNLLEELRSEIEKMDEWIPVTERLPEKEGVYLCFSKGVIETGYYNGKYWEYSGYEVTYFTHWKPLPLPPNN